MMQVIPSIDLLDGKVVRLLKGQYDAVTVYGDDPSSFAKSWRGISPMLHVVDLEGAREGRAVQTVAVRAIVEAFGPGVEIGGGVRSFDAVKSYFELGVERVVMGTAAISNPELVAKAAEAFPGRVIVAVDARDGMVATAGWLTQSERRAVDVVKELSALPLFAVLYTDIERDGTEQGPNIEQTAKLGELGGVPVIASGGVGTLQHLEALARRAESGRIIGAIIGRSLHEKRFALSEAVDAVRRASQK
jgi:phosphoribosylformimino-5-aminoimidazole carboxamide ribotide isomerase